MEPRKLVPPLPDSCRKNSDGVSELPCQVSVAAWLPRAGSADLCVGSVFRNVTFGYEANSIRKPPARPLLSVKHG